MDIWKIKNHLLVGGWLGPSKKGYTVILPHLMWICNQWDWNSFWAKHCHGFWIGVQLCHASICWCTCCQVSLTTCIKGKQQEKRCLSVPVIRRSDVFCFGTDQVKPFMFTTQKKTWEKWCSFCYSVISGELRSQGFDSIFLLNEELKNTRILNITG